MYEETGGEYAGRCNQHNAVACRVVMIHIIICIPVGCIWNLIKQLYRKSKSEKSQGEESTRDPLL